MTYWETTKGTLELLAGYVAITRSFFSEKKNLGTHGGWFTAFSNTFLIIGKCARDFLAHALGESMPTGGRGRAPG